MMEEKLNEGLALVQLYPGPIMVDLTPCVGCRLRSMPGAVLASVPRRLLGAASSPDSFWQPFFPTHSYNSITDFSSAAHCALL